MKIAVFGVPRSGKDFLAKHIHNFRHIKGSAFLNERSSGKFKNLPEEKKVKLRKDFIEYINTQNDSNIVVDGHYSFPNNNGGYDIVFTKNDGDCYDKFIYLDTSAEEILKRMSENEKNKIYQSLSNDEIERWKKFEINALRKECFSRNKEFIIFDDDFSLHTKFITLMSNGSAYADSYGAAKEIADTINKASGNTSTICLLDCDRTLSKNDTTTDFLKTAGIEQTILAEIFKGSRYSSYQFWKAASMYADIEDYGQYCQIAAKKANMNRRLINDLNMIPDSYKVGLTAGIYKVWNIIKDREGFLDVVFGGSNTRTDNRVISDMTKGYAAKILREQGKKIIAVGDSMTDLLMLENADNGYVIAEEKKSASLQDYFTHKKTSIRQPAYNSYSFEGIKTVRSIHEDTRA